MAQVEWAPFIKACQDVVGVSPTRGLDEHQIDLKHPKAFIASLDCKNNPQEAMKNAAPLQHLCHGFLSFFAILTEEHLQYNFVGVFPLYAKMCIHFIKGEDKRIMIMSGTLATWREVLLACNHHLVPTIIREFSNELYTMFKSAGLRDLWHGYKQIFLPNNTFELRTK